MPTGTSTLLVLAYGWDMRSPQMRAYDLAGTLDGLAFLDQSVGTEEHNTDLAGFEVHAHALDTGGEPFRSSVYYDRVAHSAMRLYILDQLLGLDIVHAMDTSDTITLPLVSMYGIVIFRVLFSPTQQTGLVRSQPNRPLPELL